MDFRSSSDCFMQTTTQTDKQQTETKVVRVFLAGFSLLSGREGIGLFGGNHVVSWAVTVLPCTRHACICTLRFQTSLHPQTMQVTKKHKKQFFSVCVMVSHCSVAEEALDPFSGNHAVSLPVTALTCLCLPCSRNRHVGLHRNLKNTRLCATHRDISALESACGGVETLLAEENNILQHKHRQQQQPKKTKKTLRQLGRMDNGAFACHLRMYGLLDTTSSHGFMQTTTQTDKQQTETKVVPVFGTLLTALWQRRNWTLWWEPCRLVGSHSSSMHTPCLHLHFAVPNIASCADHARDKETQKIKFFSVCVMVSHCSVAEEALDPFVGTMLSRCQSQL